MILFKFLTITPVTCSNCVKLNCRSDETNRQSEMDARLQTATCQSQTWHMLTAKLLVLTSANNLATWTPLSLHGILRLSIAVSRIECQFSKGCILPCIWRTDFQLSQTIPVALSYVWSDILRGGFKSDRASGSSSNCTVTIFIRSIAYNVTKKYQTTLHHHTGEKEILSRCPDFSIQYMMRIKYQDLTQRADMSNVLILVHTYTLS